MSIEYKIEAIKEYLREERAQGTTKQDLINQTPIDNSLIEEVYSE